MAYSLHLFRGDWARCMTAVRKCRRFGDRSPEVDIFEAEMHLRLLSPERAVALLNKDFSASLQVAAWGVRASAMSALGQHECLSKELHVFLQSQQTQLLGHAVLWKELGAAYDKQKRYDDAFTTFRCANEIEKRGYHIKD